MPRVSLRISRGAIPKRRRNARLKEAESVNPSRRAMSVIVDRFRGSASSRTHCSSRIVRTVSANVCSCPSNNLCSDRAEIENRRQTETTESPGSPRLAATNRSTPARRASCADWPRSRAPSAAETTAANDCSSSTRTWTESGSSSSHIERIIVAASSPIPEPLSIGVAMPCLGLSKRELSSSCGTRKVNMRHCEPKSREYGNVVSTTHSWPGDATDSRSPCRTRHRPATIRFTK